MSMYNMMNGMNAELAIIASAVLGYNIQKKFPRFRDIFTEAEDAPFKADLFIYTRMGGGNRECWGNDTPELPCTCGACTCDGIEEEPWCVGSYDDDFDCTYRTFGIKFTDEQRVVWDKVIHKELLSEELVQMIKAVFPKMFEKKEEVVTGEEAKEE